MAKLNILTLNSSKNYTDLASLGLTNVTVDDTEKSITFTLTADGSQHTIHFEQPSDGMSVIGVNDKGDGAFTLSFSDGTESEAIQTVKGKEGYTPVKGTDYWTSEDISEIQSYIDTQIGGALNGSY